MTHDEAIADVEFIAQHWDARPDCRPLADFIRMNSGPTHEKRELALINFMDYVSQFIARNRVQAERGARDERLLRELANLRCELTDMSAAQIEVMQERNRIRDGGELTPEHKQAFENVALKQSLRR